jgi:hypothetical protein
MTLCQQDCRDAAGSVAKDGLYGRVLGLSHGSNSIVVTSGRNSRTFGINENFFVGVGQGQVERLVAPPPFIANRLEGRRQAERQEARADVANTAKPVDREKLDPEKIGHEKVSAGGFVAESRPNPKPVPLPRNEYISTQNLGEETRKTSAPRIVIYPLTDGADKALVDTSSTLFDTSNNLTSFDLTGACATCTSTNTVLNTSSITDAGSLLLADGASIYWGRWDSGAITSSEPNATTVTSSSAGVPFVVGDAATRLPTSGSFVYTFAGGPTAVDTTGAVGGSLTQGAFQVSFGATQSIAVVTPLKLSVGGVNYTLSTACGGACSFNGPSAWMNMSLSGVCSGGTCVAATPVAGEATALLVGSQASGLTVAGNISSPASTVTFTGAFNR